MNDDINMTQQEIMTTRKKLDDMKTMAIGNIRLAKVNLFMGKIIWVMQISILMSTIIIAYMIMFYFVAKQSFPLTLGFWYLIFDVGIFWIPAWIGYMIWKTLARQEMKRRTKLLENQRKAEESYTKVMELRKNAESLIQKLEVLK